MTTDEIMALQADAKAWAETPAGAAFTKFESQIAAAWITDQRDSSSDAAMKRDWNAANAARAEIVAEIRKLQGTLKP
jgi:hypothetical protein